MIASLVNSRPHTLQLMVMGYLSDVNPLDGPIVNDGEWHHVGVVYDGTYMTLYVDGVNSTEPTLRNYQISSPSSSSSQDNYLGRSNHVGSEQGYFTGSMDDLRFYSRALSESEVWSLYLGQHDSPSKSPILPFLSYAMIFPNESDVVYVWYLYDGTCKYHLICF